MSSFTKTKTDTIVADLLSLGVNVEPAHDEFGIVISSIVGQLKDVALPQGWLRPLVERYGLVIIKDQHDLIENEAEKYVPTIRQIFADPCRQVVEDIAAGHGGKSPEIQVLGSPNSTSHPDATFIPARPAETPDSLREWLEEGKPCAVTDWHSDEPWESHPPKYTLALCAESTGPNATMYSSTVALYNRTDDTIKNRLDGAQTLFVPPHWLPSEVGKQARHGTVQVRSDESSSNNEKDTKSFYMVMDSTGSIDGIEDGDEAKKLIWELTKDAMKPEHVYSHQWQKGDLVFWDDTRTLHARTPYAQNSVDRVLYRMRVLGTNVEDHKGNTNLVYIQPKRKSSLVVMQPKRSSSAMDNTTTSVSAAIREAAEWMESRRRSSIVSIPEQIANTTNKMIRPLRVGVIGGGPAGLMAAKMLSRDGHSVTVYEARNTNTHGCNLNFDAPSDEYFNDILGMDMTGFVPFNEMQFYGPSGTGDRVLEEVDRDGWQVLRPVLIDRLMPDQGSSYTVLNNTKAKVVKNQPNEKVVLELCGDETTTEEEFDFCIAADGGNSQIRRTEFENPVECIREDGYYEVHGIALCPKKYIHHGGLQFYLAPQQGERYPIIFAMTSTHDPDFEEEKEEMDGGDDSSELVSWLVYAHSNTDLKKELQNDPLQILSWARKAMDENFMGPEVSFISNIMLQPSGDLLNADDAKAQAKKTNGTNWIYMSTMWSMQDHLQSLIKNNVFLVGDAAHKFLPHAGGNLSLVLAMLNDFHTQLNNTEELLLTCDEEEKEDEEKKESSSASCSGGFNLQDIIDQTTMLEQLENIVKAKEVAESRLKNQNSQLCHRLPNTEKLRRTSLKRLSSISNQEATTPENNNNEELRQASFKELRRASFANSRRSSMLDVVRHLSESAFDLSEEVATVAGDSKQPFRRESMAEMARRLSTESSTMDDIMDCVAWEGLAPESKI